MWYRFKHEGETVKILKEDIDSWADVGAAAAEQHQKPKYKDGARVILDKDVASTDERKIKKGTLVINLGNGNYRLPGSDKSIMISSKDIIPLFARPKFENGAEVILAEGFQALNTKGQPRMVHGGASLIYVGPTDTSGMLKFEIGSEDPISISVPEDRIKHYFENYSTPEIINPSKKKPLKIKNLKPGTKIVTTQKVPLYQFGTAEQLTVVPKESTITYTGPSELGPERMEVSYHGNHGYIWTRHVQEAITKKSPKPHQGPQQTEFKEPTFEAKFLSTKEGAWEEWGKKFKHAELSKQEIRTLLDYTENSGINYDLRNQTMDKYTREETKKLDNILKSKVATIPTAVKVRRNVGEGHPLVKLLVSGGLKPGMFYKDPAFQSTSLDKNFKGSGGYHLHISVPKGAKGIYIGAHGEYKLTQYEFETEVLFPRNTGTRVLSYDLGKKIIECEQV